tara:strand:- start:9847 stop:10932 length:1086 start_codon:yes stop_codon:yes gene_type:complete
MRVLLKKTRDILKLWSKENSIKDVSNIMGIPYKKLIDNYLKKFWKNDYLDKISKGRYILNKKGKSKINQDLNLLKLESLLLKLSKKRFTNEEIKKELKSKLNLELTDSSIFSKISRLRKLYEIKHRRIKEININIDNNFYEFLGLILSDGYIGKYEVVFTNKDYNLISYYKSMIKKWGQKTYQIKGESGASRLSTCSINLVALVNKFLNKKESLSDDILNGKINYQNCFLRGLYSGDGCIAISITPRKEKWRVESFISLAVFNDKLMPSLIGLLKSLGYNPVFDKNQIRMHKKEDIKKFYKEIGFIKGGKIRQSQYWRGYEKNQVLKYVANYMGSDNELKGLKKGTKEEIIKHIKTQLTRM